MSAIDPHPDSPDTDRNLDLQLGQMINGYRTTFVLITAAQLGIFDHLAAQPMPEPELAERVGASQQPFRRFLRALTALNLIVADHAGMIRTTNLGGLLCTSSQKGFRNWITLVAEEYCGTWFNLSPLPSKLAERAPFNHQIPLKRHDSDPDS